MLQPCICRIDPEMLVLRQPKRCMLLLKLLTIKGMGSATMAWCSSISNQPYREQRFHCILLCALLTQLRPTAATTGSQAQHRHACSPIHLEGCTTNATTNLLQHVPGSSAGSVFWLGPRVVCAPGIDAGCLVSCVQSFLQTMDGIVHSGAPILHSRSQYDRSNLVSHSTCQLPYHVVCIFHTLLPGTHGSFDGLDAVTPSVKRSVSLLQGLTGVHDVLQPLHCLDPFLAIVTENCRQARHRVTERHHCIVPHAGWVWVCIDTGSGIVASHDLAIVRVRRSGCGHIFQTLSNPSEQRGLQKAACGALRHIERGFAILSPQTGVMHGVGSPHNAT